MTTRFESNADDGEFFLLLPPLCNRFQSFFGGMLFRLLLCASLCIAKIAGMVSFPAYKALFHRHKCFNRNGGVPSISFVGFVEKLRENLSPSGRIVIRSRILIDINEITLLSIDNYARLLLFQPCQTETLFFFSLISSNVQYDKYVSQFFFFFHLDLYCLILKHSSNNKSSPVLVKRYRREFLTFLNISWECTLLFSVETSCTFYIYIYTYSEPFNSFKSYSSLREMK